MSAENPYEVLSVDDFPVVGPDGNFKRCPRCLVELESGFIAGAAVGFLTNRSMSGFLTSATSIRPNATWWQRFWDSAKYYPASLCRQCGCFMIDGSQTFGYFSARKLARQRLKP
ncbi:MAG: hypothetical protein ACK58L_16340 [Planctomycetota bacterium]